MQKFDAMRTTFAACLLALFLAAGPAASSDRHAGYYYPAPQTREVYVARVETMSGASRQTRIAFVTGLTAQQSRLPQPPSYHLFAKGAEAEKFILVAVDEHRYNTLYRLRALLAAMTALARSTPVFRDEAMEDTLTFLDLCKMMGVELLTVSDGATLAHQIEIR